MPGNETVMCTAPCVVLYGNSIYLAGIQAELKLHSALKLVMVATDCPNATDFIRSLAPAVVIFDLFAAQPVFAISLLRDQPGLLFIGVHPSCNKMLLLTGQYASALSVSDLVDIINKRARVSLTPPCDASFP